MCQISNKGFVKHKIKYNNNITCMNINSNKTYKIINNLKKGKYNT